MIKKRLKRIKKYTCEYCKEEQLEVIEWRTTSVGYLKDLNGDYIKHDKINPRFFDISDLESYACPACNKDLSIKLIKKLKL